MPDGDRMENYYSLKINQQHEKAQPASVSGPDRICADFHMLASPFEAVMLSDELDVAEPDFTSTGVVGFEAVAFEILPQRGCEVVLEDTKEVTQVV